MTVYKTTAARCSAGLRWQPQPCGSRHPQRGTAQRGAARRSGTPCVTPAPPRHHPRKRSSSAVTCGPLPAGSGAAARGSSAATSSTSGLPTRRRGPRHRPPPPRLADGTPIRRTEGPRPAQYRVGTCAAILHPHPSAPPAPAPATTRPLPRAPPPARRSRRRHRLRASDGGRQWR